MITPPRRDARFGSSTRRAGGDARNLLLRVASAVVLVPTVLVLAYVGGWFFLALCALAAAGILWEWARLVTGRSDLRILLPGWAALAVALASTGTDQSASAAIALTAGAVLAGLLGFALSGSRDRDGHVFWAVGGVAYAGIAFLGPALLRQKAGLGLLAFLFVAAIVWLTDICAFAAGRMIGGPLLWPSISPNKTWSGALGGLLGGIAGGVLVAYAGGIGRLAIPALLAALLSVLAQAGDLLESAIKRRFGAKDTSQLIPGHGGLMDRLDGFVVACVAALLIGLLHQGTTAPAQGLLIW
ncbi:MAG: phosphatidate cytidylyltransferase [Xanthobacteraceae bacterium]